MRKNLNLVGKCRNYLVIFGFLHQ